MSEAVASRRVFYGVSALVFASSLALTIVSSADYFFRLRRLINE